jgi:hypothetical protein
MHVDLADNQQWLHCLTLPSRAGGNAQFESCDGFARPAIWRRLEEVAARIALANGTAPLRNSCLPRPAHGVSRARRALGRCRDGSSCVGVFFIALGIAVHCHYFRGMDSKTIWLRQHWQASERRSDDCLDPFCDRKSTFALIQFLRRQLSNLSMRPRKSANSSIETSSASANSARAVRRSSLVRLRIRA